MTSITFFSCSRSQTLFFPISFSAANSAQCPRTTQRILCGRLISKTDTVGNFSKCILLRLGSIRRGMLLSNLHCIGLSSDVLLAPGSSLLPAHGPLPVWWLFSCVICTDPRLLLRHSLHCNRLSTVVSLLSVGSVGAVFWQDLLLVSECVFGSDQDLLPRQSLGFSHVYRLAAISEIKNYKVISKII